MILITGATGTIGSEVLRLLAARGEVVRALTRDPSRAWTPPGVEVVAGDFDDPASLDGAMAGVGGVFLVAPGGPSTGRHDLAVLAAARSARVRRVVKLSSIGADATDDHWHRPGEEAVRAGDMGWTLLRPSAFASNTLRWAGAIRADEPVPNMTGTAAQGVIDPRDIAEIAAEALVSAKHEGRTYTLTGPELLSFHDQVARLETALGRTIRTVDVPLDVVRERMLASGMDVEMAESRLRGIRIIRDGGNAVLTDGVERALGRPPTDFGTWALDHLDAFTTS
ncbi:NAD(P)H-binding protein [Streptosporangium sp. NPDC004379]|uniref:NAD(P)H-binding protein n=1 Tax=Streptosporangium sp. NPDC004379 TaxID=3366189 RepID=UPI003693E03E